MSSLRKLNNLLNRVNPYCEKDFTLVLGSSVKGEERDVIAILHPTIGKVVKMTVLFRQFNDLGVVEIKDHIGPISIKFDTGVWNTPANFSRYLKEISVYKEKVTNFLE